MVPSAVRRSDWTGAETGLRRVGRARGILLALWLAGLLNAALTGLGSSPA